jgi:hypothetical protein
MKAQAIFFDRDTRPDLRDQISFVDDFTCVLYEGNKDIKSTTTQLDWTATLLEKPLGDRQSKTSEEDDIVFHLKSPLIHFGFLDGTTADRSFTATVTREIAGQFHCAFVAAIKLKDSLPCASFR